MKERRGEQLGGEGKWVPVWGGRWRDRGAYKLGS